MAVLIEAISVVIKADAVLARFQDDWEVFKRTVPNATLCADGELACVSFRDPSHVERYVNQLEGHGLQFIVDGQAQDLVVVDQQRGATVACGWLDVGRIDFGNDPAQPVAAARLKGSTLKKVITPEGWQFEGSLSQSFRFVERIPVAGRHLNFLRREGDRDIYLDSLTGEEVFVARQSEDDE